MEVFYQVEGHLTRVWSTDALRWKVGVKDPQKNGIAQVYIAFAIKKQGVIFYTQAMSGFLNKCGYSCVRLIHKTLRVTLMKSWRFLCVALVCSSDRAGHSAQNPIKYELGILLTRIIKSSYKVSHLDTFVRSIWFKKNVQHLGWQL